MDTFLSFLGLVVFVGAVGGALYWFKFKKPVAAPAPTPNPVPTPNTRPYGTGLRHISPDNNSIGLNPDGVQEFANGPESFID